MNIMESNKIFEELQKRGYVVHNKRVLGNPLHASEETKLKDLTQEFALVVEWLRVNHGIWIEVRYMDDVLNFGYVITTIKNNTEQKECYNFNTPQEAYSVAFDYVLGNLI